MGPIGVGKYGAPDPSHPSSSISPPSGLPNPLTKGSHLGFGALYPLRSRPVKRGDRGKRQRECRVGEEEKVKQGESFI